DQPAAGRLSATRTRGGERPGPPPRALVVAGWGRRPPRDRREDPGEEVGVRPWRGGSRRAESQSTNAEAPVHTLSSPTTTTRSRRSDRTERDPAEEAERFRRYRRTGDRSLRNELIEEHR